MSKKDKHQRVTFRSIIRLIIFLILVWIIITFINQQIVNKKPVINDPTVAVDEVSNESNGDVLGEMYSQIPENNRHQLEIFLNNSSQFIQQKLNGFPQKQIKEIKKAIIKNVSDEMIQNIDKN